MDAGTNKKIRDFVLSVGKSRKDLKCAYLFGSYVSGSDGYNSDIDVALIMSDLSEDERFEFQVQMMVLASDFDPRIEPHPFSEKKFNQQNPFAAEIIKTGIKINALDSK